MIVLDTHAVIWYAAGHRLRQTAVDAIELALNGPGVLLSAISAWEIGMLAAKKRIVLQVSVEEYVRTLFQRDGIVEEPVSAEIALLSTTLPNFYGDPADRIIVATAMVNSVPVVTRDEPMMRYLKKTKLAQCIAC